MSAASTMGVIAAALRRLVVSPLLLLNSRADTSIYFRAPSTYVPPGVLSYTPLPCVDDAASKNASFAPLSIATQSNDATHAFTGDQYTTDMGVLDMPTGDFTVEFLFWRDAEAVAASDNSLIRLDGPGSLPCWLVRCATSNVRFGCYNAAGSFLSEHTASVSLPANTWHHVAFVRVGAQVYSYVNGSKFAATGIVTPMMSGATRLHILGSNNGSTVNGTLKIDSVAIWGFAKYTAASIPVLVTAYPDAIPPPPPGGTLLFHFDTDTVSTGSLTNSIPAGSVGTPTKFGAAALTVGGYIDNTPSTPPDFTGDFCVDSWAYIATGASYTNWQFGAWYVVISSNIGDGGDWDPVSIPSAGAALIFDDGSTYFDRVPLGGTVTLDAFNHIEFSRTSGVMRLFLGGVLVGTYTSSATLTPSFGFFPPFPSGGAIDEVRIQYDVGGHTANFTPPTAPY